MELTLRHSLETRAWQAICLIRTSAERRPANVLRGARRWVETTRSQFDQARGARVIENVHDPLKKQLPRNRPRPSLNKPGECDVMY